METPSFKEDHISQIPALQLLQKLGYTYLSPAEAEKLRGGKTSNVLLEDILRTQLKEIIIGEPAIVKLKGRFLEVITNDKAQVKQLVTDWYLLNARVKLYAIAQPLINKFKRYNVTPSSIVLRDMPTRWGSCTPKGKILLNPELIKAAKGCIEYVIIHELCHLVYHDHTQKFIDLQTKEMPDWEKWKSKLERLFYCQYLSFVIIVNH